MKIMSKRAKVIDYNSINLPFLSEESIRYSVIRIFKKILYFPWIFVKPRYIYVTNAQSMASCSGTPIKIHELDYDLYLASKNKPSNNRNDNTEQYMLFLDEDCVFHSDFIYQDKQNPFTISAYYNDINSTLDTIATKLELKPLIQLHPKANKVKVKKYFSFEISEKNTADAIKDSSLIIAHASTAIQLAVLFRKPILILETEEYKKLKVSYRLLKNFASLLHCKVITPKTAHMIESIPSVNVDLYKHYEERYTKMASTEEKYSYEILSEFLIKESSKQH